MLVLEVLLAAAVLAGVAVVAAGRGDPMSDPAPDLAEVLPPGARVTASDLERVRLPVSLRGYRMGEVDELLTRLTERLRELENPGGDAPPVGAGTGQEPAEAGGAVDG